MFVRLILIQQQLMLLENFDDMTIYSDQTWKERQGSIVYDFNGLNFYQYEMCSRDGHGSVHNFSNQSRFRFDSVRGDRTECRRTIRCRTKRRGHIVADKKSQGQNGAIIKCCDIS
jgi:hypothetical protein